MTWSYTVDKMDPSTIAEICRRDGLCLIKRFFSSTEIERIQTGLVETHQNFKSAIPDLLACPSLRWILTHSCVRLVAKVLLGDDLVYYLNGSINYEREIGAYTNSPYTTLHADAFGGPDHLYQQPDRNTPFPAYRFAIYLQDYENSSGGLRVVPGSHLWTTDFDSSAADFYSSIRIPPSSRPNADPEDFIDYVPAQPGDLVIWNLNLVHGAGAKRLKDDPKRCLHPRDEAKLTKQDPSQFIPPPGPRNAIFFDYGKASPEVDFYIKGYTQNLKARGRKQFANLLTEHSEIEAWLEDTQTILREDALMVYLSLEIQALTNEAEREDEARKLYECLYNVARRHKEFSPYFMLFNRETFVALDRENWKKAVGHAQKMIVSRAVEGHPVS